MPLPTAYTEPKLAEYMHTTLGEAASVMGYGHPGAGMGAYQEQVYDALLAYGVTDIADATDMALLRALAKREAWRKVMNESAGRYDVTADEGTFKRSQLHAQAKTNFQTASAEAAQLDNSATGDDEDTATAIPLIYVP